ncbi:MAG: lanthionine synthetase LanC family protein [Nocardioides sp.]
MASERYREVAEQAWAWVRRQIRHDSQGIWIPETVPHDEAVPAWRDGLHSGVGGLGLLAAEIRLTRPLTPAEDELVSHVLARVTSDVRVTTEAGYFDGLVGHLAVLGALDAEGIEDVVSRLLSLATADGWSTSIVGPPKFLEGARLNDATLGSAGVLLGAVWALRRLVPGAQELANLAADVVVREAETLPRGRLRWQMVSPRFRATPPTDMPNWSHGTAGIAAALALAASALNRADLSRAAVAGAEHLVELNEGGAAGFEVPRYVPPVPDEEPLSYGWCHGSSGTSLLFAALEQTGVTEVASVSPQFWRERCLNSVRASGVPDRLRPGFWDNDGRCCGTAGVGDIVLDVDEPASLHFAQRLGDALVERATVDGDTAYWQFLDSTSPTPLQPPGVGWMQGAAGISAFLFRLARAVEGDRRTVDRLDSWWTLGRGPG